MPPLHETLSVALPIPEEEAFVAHDEQGAMTWSVVGGSTEKPVNDCFKIGDQVVWRKNEDRFRIVEKPEAMFAAVADGAGSSGMFCGAWAEALVERLPEAPLGDLDGLNKWIDGFWQDFSSEFKKQASGDPTKLSKFVREGSCSTLAACWIDKHIDTTAMTLHWLGYGDSPIIIFAGDDDALSLRTAFPHTLAAMESDPHLLNWKDMPKESQLKSGTIVLTGPARIILASDGIGQFVLLRYLAYLYARQSMDGKVDMSDQGKNMLSEYRQFLNAANGKLAMLTRNHLENLGDGFATELALFRKALQTQSGFSDIIKEHHAKGGLPNDDSTLVIIDIEVEAVEGAGDKPDLLISVNEP